MKMRLFIATLLITALSSFTASAEILTKVTPSIKVQQSVKAVKKHTSVNNTDKSIVKNSVMRTRQLLVSSYIILLFFRERQAPFSYPHNIF